MRETLQLHASIIDRNHHIQTMVRTITCQVPIGVDRGFSWSAPVSSADKMQMAATAASSGGYVLDGHQNTNFKAISSQRPLVDLSEAEASRTCSALKRRRNSASGLWHSGKINARMLLCVFCLIHFIRWCANQIDGASCKYLMEKIYGLVWWTHAVASAESVSTLKSIMGLKHS